MKIQGLLLPAFVLVQFAAHSQFIKSQCKNCKQQLIVLNPVGEDGITKTCLPYGSTVKFKITNVNPFKIDGTTSVVKTTVDFTVPAQFSAIPVASPEKSKDQDTLTKEEKSQVADALKKNTPESIMLIRESFMEPSLPDYRNIFVTNYDSFIKSLNQLALYTSIEDHLDSLLKDDYIPDTIVFRSNLQGYMKSINDDDADINLIRTKCRKALEQLTVYHIKAKDAYIQLNASISNEKVKLVGQLSSKDEKVALKIDSAFVSIVPKSQFEKEYQFITAKFDVINPEKKRSEIINKANAGIDLYNKINTRPFIVYTDAQQLDDDIVAVSPKLKNKKGETIKEFSAVKIKTYGGVKVNFSTGYLLSFRGDDNYTNLYDNTGVTGVQKNETDDLRHSLGALVHVYPRSCHAVTFGGSVGLSIPTDGARIGFYSGLSALMLEKHRLVLTAGIAYNKTKTLNTANLTEAPAKEGKQTYTFSNSEYKQIVLDDVYRPSFFVGITYNIFSK